MSESLSWREARMLLLYGGLGIAAVLLFAPSSSQAATTVGNNVSVGGTLDVTGATTLTGAATLSATLGVTGATTLNGNSTIGNATTTDVVYLNSRFASRLEPTANNDIDLGVYGNAWNDLFASNTIVLGTVDVATLGTSAGDLSVGNNLAVDGTGWFGGNTTLGNATTSDKIYLNSRFASRLEPTANNDISLGAYDNAWKDLYVSGTLYVGTLSAWSSSVTISNNLTVGDATTTDVLYLNSRVAGSVQPTDNNGNDLGAYSNAWNDLFASNTIVLGTVDVATLGTSAGDLSVGNNLAVDGTGWFGGNTTLGNATTSDVIYLNSRFASRLEPTANNDISLGGYGNAWANIFSSGTLWAGVLSTDGNVTLGSGGEDTITFNGAVASSVAPGTHNTYDVGVLVSGGGPAAFNDMVASGTAYMSTSTVVNAGGTAWVLMASTKASKGGAIVMEKNDGSGCIQLEFGVNGEWVTSSVSTGTYPCNF